MSYIHRLLSPDGHARVWVRVARVVRPLLSDGPRYAVSSHSVPLIALIDTGATKTGISPDVIRAFKLPAQDVTLVSTAAGLTKLKSYRIALKVQKVVNGFEVDVVDYRVLYPYGFQKSEGDNHHVLLGMDVLGLSDFRLQGFRSSFYLNFKFPKPWYRKLLGV